MEQYKAQQMLEVACTIARQEGLCPNACTLECAYGLQEISAKRAIFLQFWQHRDALLQVATVDLSSCF